MAIAAQSPGVVLKRIGEGVKVVQHEAQQELRVNLPVDLPLLMAIRHEMNVDSN